MTVQTFFKGLGGNRKGGVVVKEEHAGLLGGPHHLPHSRQPSVAPEPGRKQEVGNSRAEERGRDGGSDGGAHSHRPKGREADEPTGPREAILGSPSPPPVGEPTRGSAPRQGWGSSSPGPTRARPSGEGRQGGVVWAPGPAPRGKGSLLRPLQPSGPGAGEYVGRT